jgi:hypothetical protein
MLLFIFIYFTQSLKYSFQYLMQIWCSNCRLLWCKRETVHTYWMVRSNDFFKKRIVKWTAHRSGWNSCKLCISFISMCTKRFVQFGWSLHRHIFSILYVKNRYFIFNSVKFFLEAVLSRSPIFFDYGLNPFFPLVNGWLDVILHYKRLHIVKSLLQ